MLMEMEEEGFSSHRLMEDDHSQIIGSCRPGNIPEDEAWVESGMFKWRVMSVMPLDVQGM